MAKHSPQFHVLDKRSNFLGIDPDRSSFQASSVVIVPAPYEHTVSYGGGTRFGPQEILSASHYVEFYDEETRRDISVEAGIATLRPIQFGKKKDAAALEVLHKTVERLLGEGKFIVTLGGEHTISAAPIAAHAMRYPDLSVLQIDAHSDLRNEYEGNPYSHASVMARVCEFIDPQRIVQVGIRAQAKEEAEFIRRRGVHTLYAHEIRSGRFGRFVKHWDDVVVERLTDNVYLTFDVDGLDPSIMPATGTPEPNGLFWHEVMQCIKKVGRSRQIIGFDVVELAPIKGLSHPNLTAAKLVSKILNYSLR